ncbi:MAG: efflux RND transporter periplasmic adaptor subunit [Granulosicoccaceae bacterium]
MKTRILLSIVALIVIGGGLIFLKLGQFQHMGEVGAAMRPPPTAITAVTVERVNWETSINSIGTLEAAQGVMITADIPGRVSRLFFDGGEAVSAGDILLEQETSTETAQLDAAESDLELAQNNLDRVSRLFRNRVISRAEFDSALSQLSAAQAQVDNITATLAKKRIIAPFDGRLGLRLANIGQDLSQGVPIVSLQAIDPMRVNFSLPQQALSQVESGLAVRITTDAVPGNIFEGEITAINTEIDAVTRTVRTQATLKPTNAESNNLLPGMFAKVEVVLPAVKNVLMIPLTAVSFASFGDSVFVIEKNDNDQLSARQQFVQLGERRGDFVEVTQGLEQGQTIANDGVFKLRNGVSVKVNESSSTPSLTPQPDNA